MENRSINMHEEWVRWNPTNLPEGRYDIVNFIDNADGTKIILTDLKNIIEIYFDGLPAMARIVHTPLRMRTWGEVQDKYHKAFFVGWFLYKVENSMLSKWLEEENCGFERTEDYTHYCIATNEQYVDIISTFAPTITTRKITEEEKQAYIT